jgi:hypothetical protein
MKDFWQEIWDYLGKIKPDVSCNFILCMWEVAQFIEKREKNPNLDLDELFWAVSKFDRVHWNCEEPDVYLFLTEISKRIAEKINSRLPAGLHHRIVLGIQNEHTKQYIKRWGV